MKVAVVTPYYKESREWLERCLDSVKRQTHACDHFVVADGHPQDWLDGAGVKHVRLNQAHADFGNTPRSIGGQLAVSQGYDAIAFLDADNTLEPEHVATCLEAALESGADFVSAKRYMVRDDGSRMSVRIDEDQDGSHVDTNCLFLMFGAFHTISRWVMMPKPMAIWGDRFYLASLRQEGLKEASTPVATVNYLCTWAGVFTSIGETPPDYAKSGLPMAGFAKWLHQLQPGDLKVIQRLSGCDIVAYFDSRKVA